MKFAALFILILAFSPGCALADETMTKVVFRQEAPDLALDSYAAKPKTLYEWGKTKGRVEETPDAANQLTGLIIANGKDGWMINLWNHTGRHFIDPGPTYNFYVPIVPQEKPDVPSPVHDFQIGHEPAFMKDRKVSPTKVTKGGRSLLLYECTQDDYILQLYVDSTSGVPTESDVLKRGRFILRLIYSDYETGLPADPSIFQAPPHVKISESKS
jgi:hypothetical protein